MLVCGIGFDFAFDMFDAVTLVAISAVMELSRQAHRCANTCGFTQIDIYQYEQAVLHSHKHTLSKFTFSGSPPAYLV